MDDCHALSNYIADNHPKSAVIVGAGYIGMEMADALTRRGLKVTVVEFMDSVLMTLDSSLGVIVKNELERNDVTVKTGVAVESIRQEGNHLTIEGSPSFTVESDMVIIAAGVRPETEPARSASVETGLRGAIRVNRKLETNIPDIYAAGDCAETWHSILQEYTYLPLGTTAHKQGRIAGENAVGKKREFEGTLGTQAVKIFDMVAARTGLNNREAELAGYDPFTSQIQTWEHTLYYPNAHSIHIRLTGDRLSGKLLGAQIISHRSAEVSKRIDIIAVALYNGMTIEEINDIDLSYTPPLSSPWDPVQMAAQQWVKETSGKSPPDN
jgi:NADPH-dependent 2,4-dienoyl-CoA reductase/sulfur reductase-like enzyme